jgi:anaerobic magnesium-protoporphyrin IX monomethyl ester cyclase
MHVMLLFPPNWTPSMPHLALPTLTAFLRAHGVTVTQRDLNIEVFDAVLTRKHLQRSLDRLREQYGPRGDRTPKRHAIAPRDQIAWALAEGPRLIERVERAKQTLRSPAFFDGPLGLEAITTVAEALQLASLPFYPAALELSTYKSALTPDSSRNILRESRDPQMNLLIEQYRKGVIADIQRLKPDVVGISIPSLAQMTPGLTIAAQIKELGLPCHVTIGGPHITMLREQLAHNPAVFELIDSAVVFDGEVPLLRLCEAVAEGRDLADVPNLIWRDGEQIRVNARKEPEKISNLPIPDFDGLPLDRYLAPKLVLPLLSARGCYFGKCAFCNVGYGEAENVSLMRADPLTEQMLTLKRKYGVEQIFFCDEALAPRLLRDISRIMREHDVPLLWGGCARFEKTLGPELLQQMYDGGCRMIMFGLESASEAIMQRMVKGTTLEHMHRILEQSAAIGIWNHTFFFFGFPGETLDDAQQTVNFLYAHQEHVHSAGFGTFILEIDAPAHRFPKSFGISRVITRPEQDLAIYFDYEVSEGMDAAMAEQVADRFIDVLPKKPYPQFYVNDVYRFLYACNLSREGAALPPWLVPQETIGEGA